MGHKHAKEDLLAAAVAVAQEDGLSRLSFGRVAKKLGISDRTVVYYFDRKDQLVTEVVESVSLQLVERLAAVAAAPVSDHRDLLRAAWPVLARADADPVFALFFEAVGLAAAGTAPYDALVPALVSAWIDWAEARISGSGPHRRAEAEAAVALVDGLLLFRQVAGTEAADRVARRVGNG